MDGVRQVQKLGRCIRGLVINSCRSFAPHRVFSLPTVLALYKQYSFHGINNIMYHKSTALQLRQSQPHFILSRQHDNGRTVVTDGSPFPYVSLPFCFQPTIGVWVYIHADTNRAVVSVGRILICWYLY